MTISQAVYEAQIERIAALEAESARLRNLVLMGAEVVEDFLPNIGRCALQDYGRMNSFLVESSKLKKDSAMGEK